MYQPTNLLTKRVMVVLFLVFAGPKRGRPTPRFSIFVCPVIRSSVCLSIRPFVRPFVRLFVRLSVSASQSLLLHGP